MRRRSQTPRKRITTRFVSRRAGLGVGLAACGCVDDSNSSGRLGRLELGAAKKDYKLTLIAGVKGDEFYITMNCGAQAEAKARARRSTSRARPVRRLPADPDRQRRAAKKPDAVLIAPTDTKAMYAPIKQLADDGSKVVLVDTTLDQPDMAVSQIASDNDGGGEPPPRSCPS